MAANMANEETKYVEYAGIDTAESTGKSPRAVGGENPLLALWNAGWDAATFGVYTRRYARHHLMQGLKARKETANDLKGSVVAALSTIAIVAALVASFAFSALADDLTPAGCDPASTTPTASCYEGYATWRINLYAICVLISLNSALACIVVAALMIIIISYTPDMSVAPFVAKHPRIVGCSFPLLVWSGAAYAVATWCLAQIKYGDFKPAEHFATFLLVINMIAFSIAGLLLLVDAWNKRKNDKNDVNEALLGEDEDTSHTDGNETNSGKIWELKRLFENGLITQSEFDAKKAEFLAAW